MTAYEFIFSNRLKYRLTRHLVFWGIYYLRYILLRIPYANINTEIDSRIYLNALQDALYLMPIYLFTVYFTIYFILPKFIVKRNILFLILSVLFLVAFAVTSAYFISIVIFKNRGEQWNELDMITALYRCMSNLIAFTSAAGIIKIMKDYSLKQRENEILATENARNKLQLLKMQIHPRILFDCLHNIYIDIDAGTLYAPEMILKLAELLSYLLYDAELTQVTLAEEVSMIKTYLEIKKSEYKNKINIDFEISGETGIHYIIPVLFLPLVETFIIPFDAPDKVLTVSIEVKIIQSRIYFNFKNNQPGSQIMKTTAVQTILDNVKRRLQASHLYRFKLEIKSTSESFAILLQLEPDKFTNMQQYNIKNGRSLIYEHT